MDRRLHPITVSVINLLESVAQSFVVIFPSPLQSGCRDKDASLVEFVFLVSNRLSCEGYRRRLRSFLCSFDVCRALINSLVCCAVMSASRR